MPINDMTASRLFNQQLSAPTFSDPAAVVGGLGAVQAQDYLGSLWAVGLRTRDATEASVEQAFNDGLILRTHVLRPTWHYVAPDDIRWMLELTAPRVHQLNAYYYRQVELDDAIFAHAHDVLIKTLEDGKHATRADITPALTAAGILIADVQRFTYIVMHAELEGLICSGARRGKQQTYALLSERAPMARSLPRDEALAELTQRYFTGHAPATIKDFVWWSGLTVADARAGIDLVASELLSETVGDETYWFAESVANPHEAKSTDAYLLPNYDEYVVGYTDRSAIYDPVHDPHLDARGNFLFNHTVVYDGQVIGIWKRTLKKREVIVEFTLFAPPSAAQADAVQAAAQRYADFLGLELVLQGL